MNTTQSTVSTRAAVIVSPEFAKALVAVQGSIEGAKKGKANPAFRSKYADLGACWDACRDSLQENNIAVLQFPTEASHGHVGLCTVLVYGPTGEAISDTFQMPLKDPTNAQAAGSAITYARRYALCSVIGICPEDDDGNAAAAGRQAGGNGGQAVKPTPQAPTGENAARYWSDFESATDSAGRKAAYSALKNSGVSEPQKTELLAKMAVIIKSNP